MQRKMYYDQYPYCFHAIAHISVCFGYFWLRKYFCCAQEIFVLWKTEFIFCIIFLKKILLIHWTSEINCCCSQTFVCINTTAVFGMIEWFGIYNCMWWNITKCSKRKCIHNNGLCVICPVVNWVFLFFNIHLWNERITYVCTVEKSSL